MTPLFSRDAQTGRILLLNGPVSTAYPFWLLPERRLYIVVETNYIAPWPSRTLEYKSYAVLEPAENHPEWLTDETRLRLIAHQQRNLAFIEHGRNPGGVWCLSPHVDQPVRLNGAQGNDLIASDSVHAQIAEYFGGEPYDIEPDRFTLVEVASRRLVLHPDLKVAYQPLG